MIIALPKKYTKICIINIERIKPLAGIRLMELNHKAMQSNPEVLKLDSFLKKRSEHGVKELNDWKWFYLRG